MRTVVISLGTFGHSAAYLEAMVSRGWDVHWLKIGPGGKVDGVTPHECHGRSVHRTDVGKLNYFRYGLASRKQIRAIAPDVVHAHYASSGGLVAALSGFRPYAVTVHGSDLAERSKSFLGRAVLRRVFAAAALVNPVAEHMTDRLHDLGVAGEKILPLTFGIDLRRFPLTPRQKWFEGGTIRLLCTRSMSATVYDIPTVLRAVAEARRAGGDVRLSLPAGGTGAAECRALAADLGISDAVAFGDGYRREDLPGMMASHDAYVSASHWDGASLSLMEAMACGAFPVVSDIAANREWLTDGTTALMFPPGDAGVLARLILDLPKRQALIAEAVRANRAVVVERADRRRNLQRLLDRLESMSVDARPGGAG